MKELEEARMYLSELCVISQIGHGTVPKHIKKWADKLADQILNLSGENWRIAIIRSQLRGEGLEGFRIVKVIWQAGE